MSIRIAISKATSERILSLFQRCLDVFKDPVLRSCESFGRFSDEIYPEIWNLQYKTLLLAPSDWKFVCMNGSDELLEHCFNETSKIQLHVDYANASPTDILFYLRDLRLIYLMVEDLNVFFHNAEHYSSNDQVDDYAEKIVCQLQFLNEIISRELLLSNC